MMQVSAAALQAVEQALRRYEEEVGRTRMKDSARRTYLLHARNFVRWLKGEFVPGGKGVPAARGWNWLADGWTIDQRTGAFIFRPQLHDACAKTVLGVHFPAGGGIEEGERMIHILARHPATGHHIAYQLCQRLVSDDPPKALVDRVTKTFLDTDGDLRQTVKAVIDRANPRRRSCLRSCCRAQASLEKTVPGGQPRMWAACSLVLPSK